MVRILIALALAFGLAACDAVTSFTEGLKQMQAVESEIEQTAGIRPQVGGNWHNGKLRSISVIFPKLDDTKPISELAAKSRAAIAKNFKEYPDAFLLGFAVPTKQQTADGAQAITRW